MKYQCALIWPRRVLRLWQMWLDTNMHISPSGWSSCCWSPALIGWLEQRRYEALSDTANTAIVPLLHLLIGQGLSGNHKIIMSMVPLMMHLYMLQYVTAWINGCGDELNSIQSDKKKTQLHANAVPLPGRMFSGNRPARPADAHSVSTAQCVEMVSINPSFTVTCTNVTLSNHLCIISHHT